LLDLWRILKGVVCGSAVFCVFLLMVGVSGFPRSVLIIDGMVALLGIGGIRMFYRLRSELPWHMRPNRTRSGRRLLIVGAGRAGEILIRALMHQQHSSYEPVGFVDDDPTMFRKEIHGVQVLGIVEDIPHIVKEKNIDEIALAIPSTSGIPLSHIVDRCMEAGLKPKVVPDVETMIRASGKSIPLREVELSDLLQRETVELNVEGIEAYLRDKTVLVTGGAGSIGSEICRQVIGYGPGQLILFDQAESHLHFLYLELRKYVESGKIIPIIGDMTDRRKVKAVMERYRPQVVFHAAAYKHVPLMEMNPEEIIRNNLRGLIVVVSLAVKYGVERFVMLSTDKAVRPTSMMGVSKRLCEIFVRTLSKASSTKLMITRFGNVLGSTGSVVPLFQRQIRQGGPVTVTHPDIVRYFMTIPEAAQLVLQAGAIGQDGDLFVLNMGREMRILELAERLIKLSGMEPYRDVPIEFTGLRPGEKMYERLWVEGEVPEATAHDKILIVKSDSFPSEQVYRTINQILSAAERLDRTAMMEGIYVLVPDYQPYIHAGLSVDIPFTHRTRVLVADDDPRMLTTLREAFNHEYELIIARQGELVLQKVFAEMPDLVVLNSQMQRMNGRDVCDRIKRHPITRETPVIILREVNDVISHVAGLQDGADLYLTKPISAPKLKMAVKKLLNRNSFIAGYERVEGEA